MVERNFNLSAQDREKQKRERQRQEAQQARDVQRVQDTEKRRGINTMMNKRDHQQEQSKARDNEKLQRRIDEEIRKKVQPKPERHLRPPGMGGDTREQQTQRIHNNMQKHMGQAQENRREAERKAKNRVIDSKIKRALAEQKQQNEKTREATRSKDRETQRSDERKVGRDGLSRHRGNELGRERKP